MDEQQQKQVDDVMYETNGKVSTIVDEIREIRFSKMPESEKQVKCDSLREQFEQVMLEEEKIEKILEISA